MILKIFLCLSVVLGVFGKNEDYIGFKIYNVEFTTQRQQDNFDKLKSDIIDFVRRPSLKHNVVGKAVVPPSHVDFFEEQLALLDIKKDVVVEDLHEHLGNVERSFKRTTRDDPDRTFNFDGYYRYDEILTHLYSIANTSSSVTVEEFGRTAQDRALVYLKIAENNAEVKPVVIIEAGINPREWITVPAALNVVNKVLEQAQLLSKADWIILPVVNPDGYEYTHTNLRLWMKNRSTQSNLAGVCPGANINRNFPIQWQVSDSSSSPCSHLYAGIAPLSEIEAQMIQFIIEQYGPRATLYISLQNNGGFVSYPWHFERAASGMFRHHFVLTRDMARATNGDYFFDIGWAALGDRASGTSSDYSQENGVRYSFNVDAVQRGSDGVNIPEEEIVSVIEDMWTAVQVAVDQLFD